MKNNSKDNLSSILAKGAYEMLKELIHFSDPSYKASRHLIMDQRNLNLLTLYQTTHF